jgi:hypothetical protein
LDVRMMTVLAKSTVRPLPSVSRPSSITCSRAVSTDTCAFSISSKSTTVCGVVLTASVSCPPASWPTNPGGEPMRRWMECLSEYSDMSSRTFGRPRVQAQRRGTLSRSIPGRWRWGGSGGAIVRQRADGGGVGARRTMCDSSSKSSSARALASSVFPTPVGPRNLAGRFHPQFHGKNRRDIGQSQSKWTASKDRNARLVQERADRLRGAPQPRARAQHRLRHRLDRGILGAGEPAGRRAGSAQVTPHTSSTRRPDTSCRAPCACVVLHM